MSVTCQYCGEGAGRGFEIGHRSNCAELRLGKIKACPHAHTHATGHQGHAMCFDCGAILPDEDPDIRSKA